MRATMTLLAMLLGGVVGPLPGEGSPPWDGQTFRRHLDDVTGISFDVPMLGGLVETRHFDRKTADAVIKDGFTLSGANGLEVTVDVFTSAAPVDVTRFFDANLAYMRDGATSVSPGFAGVRRWPALVVERPRGGGSFAQPSTIFSIGSRVFRVTCNDEDDGRAATVYARVVATLDVAKAAK